MGTQEVAQAFLDAQNAKDFDTVATYLADHFQFSGPVPEPIGGAEWVGLLKVLAAAFPDLQLNVNMTSVEGNVVGTTNQLSGTHTADLDLSMMGMGVVPATGRSFSLPVEEGEGVWDGDKIVSIHIPSGEGSGLMGILAQIGVEPPAM
jgi:predicted ester cyclase